MKNRLILSFVVVILISSVSCVCAEEMNYQNALELIRNAGMSVAMLLENKSDDETKEILRFCQYQFSLSESRISSMASINNEIEDYDWFADEEEESSAVGAEYSVQPAFVEELGYGLGYNVYKWEDYVKIDSYIYTKDLQVMLEHTRIESATRPDSDETMVLLTQIRYEDLLTSSNRYLVYSDGSAAKSLYRRTFGTDTEYRVDLALWAEGQNYEWDEKLLYPKK